MDDLDSLEWRLFIEYNGIDIVFKKTFIWKSRTRLIADNKFENSYILSLNIFFIILVYREMRRPELLLIILMQMVHE